MSRDKPKPGPKKPAYEPVGDNAKLAYFIEELAEVLEATGKTLRWGPCSYNPELPIEARETNVAWLQRELWDLRAAIERLPIGGWPHLDDAIHVAHPLAYLCDAAGQAFMCAAQLVEMFAAATPRGRDEHELEPKLRDAAWLTLAASMPRLEQASRFVFTYVHGIGVP